MFAFIKGIPFCLELNLIPGTTKANFKMSLGETSDVVFELKENTLVGKALYEDGFPLEYEVHPSLKHLNKDERLICEMLIHCMIFLLIPKLFLQEETPSIQLTPKFPAYVTDGRLLSMVS